MELILCNCIGSEENIGKSHWLVLIQPGSGRAALWARFTQWIKCVTPASCWLRSTASQHWRTCASWARLPMLSCWSFFSVTSLRHILCFHFTEHLFLAHTVSVYVFHLIFSTLNLQDLQHAAGISTRFLTAVWIGFFHCVTLACSAAYCFCFNYDFWTMTLEINLMLL